MRVSKLPYKNFEYNMRRAEAIARLDGYLNDLLYNKGKRTIEPLFKIPNEMMQVFGIDKIIERALEKTVENIKTEFEAELKQKGKEQYASIAEKYVEKLKPRLLRIERMFEDLGLLMDQTLLGQGLVAAVSAFEVYLKELLVSVVALNPKIRKRFYPEISKGLSVTKLEEYGQDAERAQAEIVADCVRLDVNTIKSLLHRLLDEATNIIDDRIEQKLPKIFAVRNVIIHQAGFIDPKFKRITKSRSSIDKPITLTQRYVLDSIKTLKLVAERIENCISRVSS